MALKLVDGYGRNIKYIRLSVTDRCNLRCRYCMPAEGIRPISHKDVLSYEEIKRLVKIFYSLGVDKVRLTGGEPLVRKGIVDLVRMLSSIASDIKVTITTNGVLFSEKAVLLKEAGLSRVNISLDTLNKKKFAYITRGGNLEDVIRGIDSAIECGFNPVKLNVVVIRNFNTDEVLDILNFAAERGCVVRFIEFMPVDRRVWKENSFVSIKEIEDIIKKAGRLLPADEVGYGPAVYYMVEGLNVKVGIIAAVSSHFCDRCNRLRITADGKLLGCLFSSSFLDLKSMLRQGFSDEKIVKEILSFIKTKPKGYMAVKDEQTFAMTKIGG